MAGLLVAAPALARCRRGYFGPSRAQAYGTVYPDGYGGTTTQTGTKIGDTALEQRLHSDGTAEVKTGNGVDVVDGAAAIDGVNYGNGQTEAVVTHYDGSQTRVLNDECTGDTLVDSLPPQLLPGGFVSVGGYGGVVASAGAGTGGVASAVVAPGVSPIPPAELYRPPGAAAVVVAPVAPPVRVVPPSPLLRVLDAFLPVTY